MTAPEREPKDQLVKARVTSRMKRAVLAASITKGDTREAEAIVIREALGEYLTERGYLQPNEQSPPPPSHLVLYDDQRPGATSPNDPPAARAAEHPASPPVAPPQPPSPPKRKPSRKRPA